MDSELTLQLIASDQLMRTYNHTADLSLDLEFLHMLGEYPL